VYCLLFIACLCLCFVCVCVCSFVCAFVCLSGLAGCLSVGCLLFRLFVAIVSATGQRPLAFVLLCACLRNCLRAYLFFVGLASVVVVGGGGGVAVSVCLLACYLRYRSGWLLIGRCCYSVVSVICLPPRLFVRLFRPKPTKSNKGKREAALANLQ